MRQIPRLILLAALLAASVPARAAQFPVPAIPPAPGIAPAPATGQRRSSPRIPPPTGPEIRKWQKIENRRTREALGEAEGRYAPPPDISLPLGIIQKAFDHPKPAPDQIHIGVKEYEWSQDLIMRLRLRIGMVTAVQFPIWENVESVYLGDHTLFNATVASRNLVLFTALRAGADTNAVITAASGNVYQFYIRGESDTSKMVPDMEVYIDAVERLTPGAGPYNTGSPVPAGGPLVPVSTFGSARWPATAPFNVPTDPPPTPAGKADFAQRIPYDPAGGIYDMGIFVPKLKDAAIAPKRVWHDQAFTYFDFGRKAESMPERPVVSLVIDGVDTPVNTRTAGPHDNVIVADAIGNFTLRDGRKVVCVKLLPHGEKPLTLTARAVGSKSPKTGS